MFPEWLADHWGVPKASQLPLAAVRRVVRRIGGNGSEAGNDLSMRRAP
jgi:hypothetical protein